MNRFYWVTAGEYAPGESVLHQQRGVRLYDGESRTNFDSGTAILTNFRLLWDDEEQEASLTFLAMFGI